MVYKSYWKPLPGTCRTNLCVIKCHLLQKKTKQPVSEGSLLIAYFFFKFFMRFSTHNTWNMDHIFSLSCIFSYFCFLSVISKISKIIIHHAYCKKKNIRHLQLVTQPRGIHQFWNTKHCGSSLWMELCNIMIKKPLLLLQQINIMHKLATHRTDCQPKVSPWYCSQRNYCLQMVSPSRNL